MLKYFFAINLSILVCFLLFKMYQSKKEPFTTPPSCDTECPAEENKHTINYNGSQYIKCCPQDQYASVATNKELSCTNCPRVDDHKYNGKYNTKSLTGQIQINKPSASNVDSTIGHCQAKCKNGDTTHSYNGTEYNGDECGYSTNYTPMTSDETISSSNTIYHYADSGSSPTQTMKKKTIDYSIGSNELCPDSQKVSDDYCCISGKEPRKNRKNGNNIKCCGSNEYLDDANQCTTCPDSSGKGSYSNDGISACYITGQDCIDNGYEVNGGESPGSAVLTSSTNTNTRIYHTPTTPPTGSYNCKMYECSFDTTTDITPSIPSPGSPAIPLTCGADKMYESTGLSDAPVSYHNTSDYTMFYANGTANTTPTPPIHSKYKNSVSVDGEYAKYYLCPANHYLREDEGSSASPTKYGCCPQNNYLSNGQCIDLLNDPTKAIADDALKEGHRTGDCLPYYYQDSTDSVCTKCTYSVDDLDITKYGNDTMWEKLYNVEINTDKITNELSVVQVMTLDECKEACSDIQTSTTNDCRLIEFTPSISSSSSTPATCKLYDLPQPTPSSSPPSDTDNGEWFQPTTSTPSEKELYLLNCASGTKNLTHYQYVTSTSTDTNCIGKMLMKAATALADRPRYCRWKSCNTDEYSEDVWNNCFPESEGGSNIYCNKTENNTENQCLTFGDLKWYCEDSEKIEERHNKARKSIPTNKIYQYSKISSNTPKIACTEADMDDCKCALTPCPEGEYVSDNKCESCTSSDEYLNSEGTGCAKFFIDQTKYFYIKQGDSYINGDIGNLFLTTNKTSAFIFKITNSTSNHTVTLQSGNDKLYVEIKNRDYLPNYAVGFNDGSYSDSLNSYNANSNDYFQLEIIGSYTDTECDVKIYNAVNSKFLKNNSSRLNLQDIYEESTCKFTLKFTCSDTEIRDSGGQCLTCPDGYEVVNNDCMETAETYNERLRDLLKASYDDCHVEFRGVNDAIYTRVNKDGRSEWMEGDREHGENDPWDNLKTGDHWSGPAPYLRNSDLTNENHKIKTFVGNVNFNLDNWGRTNLTRIMLVGRNCCFREYEHPIGTPGGNPNTQTCNDGTPYQEAKKQATLSAVDIWLKSPEIHITADQKLRQTSNPT
jgi:hypothetical protein